MVLTDDLKTQPATQEITDQDFYLPSKRRCSIPVFLDFLYLITLTSWIRVPIKARIMPRQYKYQVKHGFSNQAIQINLRVYPQFSQNISFVMLFTRQMLLKSRRLCITTVHSPLLLDKQTFNRRVFLLLHINLSAYVLSNFLAIFSLESYDHLDIQNTRTRFTNISHQEVLSIDKLHRCIRSFDETKQDIVECGLVKGK